MHGTQKPVECMRRPILNNSSPGQAVYDPFIGSGTTLIAAETTGRICLGIELNPAYVDVAIERWQRFTGQAGALRAPASPSTEEGRAALGQTFLTFIKGPATMATGRPPHEPTRDSRRLVEHHAATGTLHRQIAKLVGVSLNTLKKHYRRGARARARPRQCRGQRHAVRRGEEGQHHRLHLLAEDPRLTGARPRRSSTAAAPRSRSGRSMRPSSRTRPSTS